MVQCEEGALFTFISPFNTLDSEGEVRTPLAIEEVVLCLVIHLVPFFGAHWCHIGAILMPYWCFIGAIFGPGAVV